MPAPLAKNGKKTAFLLLCCFFCAEKAAGYYEQIGPPPKTIFQDPEEVKRIKSIGKDYIGPDLIAYCEKSFSLKDSQEKCKNTLKGKRVLDFNLKFCGEIGKDSDERHLFCMEAIADKAFQWEELGRIYREKNVDRALKNLHISWRYTEISHDDKGDNVVIYNCANTSLFFELRTKEFAPSEPSFRRTIAYAKEIKLYKVENAEFTIATEGKPLKYDLPISGLYVIKWVEETERFELFPEEGNIICD